MQVRLIWTHAPGVERFTETTIRDHDSMLDAIKFFDKDTYNYWIYVMEGIVDAIYEFDENFQEYEVWNLNDPADDYLFNCCFFSEDFERRIEFTKAVDRMWDRGLSRERISRESARLFQPFVDQANRLRGLEPTSTQPQNTRFCVKQKHLKK